MSDSNTPIAPSNLPPLSDVYFRRLFVPLVISILVLVFIFVMISSPTTIAETQTFIGGGNLNFLKKYLSI